MKIKTTDKCRTVNNAPVKPGAVVETDECTARNLIKKGFATAADSEAEKLNLDWNSRQTKSMAEASIARTIADRARMAEINKAQAARLAA